MQPYKVTKRDLNTQGSRALRVRFLELVANDFIDWIQELPDDHWIFSREIDPELNDDSLNDEGVVLEALAYEFYDSMAPTPL